MVKLKIRNVVVDAIGPTEHSATESAFKKAMLQLLTDDYAINIFISFALHNLYTKWEESGHDVKFNISKVPSASVCKYESFFRTGLPDREIKTERFNKLRSLPPRDLDDSFEITLGNKYKKLYMVYFRKLKCLETRFKRKLSKRKSRDINNDSVE